MTAYDLDLLETAVNAASPAELTLLLYDGAIRFTNNAIAELQDDRFEEAQEDIARVGNIIHEFRVTLDDHYPISEPLDDLYQYMYRRLALTTAGEEEPTPVLMEVRDMLRDFRDTWKKAMDLSAVQTTASE